MLSCAELDVEVAGRLLVESLTLSLAPGRFVALLGPVPQERVKPAQPAAPGTPDTPATPGGAAGVPSAACQVAMRWRTRSSRPMAARASQACAGVSLCWLAAIPPGPASASAASSVVVSNWRSVLVSQPTMDLYNRTRLLMGLPTRSQLK